jgi:Protein of unknown function (DUF1275)
MRFGRLLNLPIEILNDLVQNLNHFSTALQNTSFSNTGPWQFNSAMTTSNLRNAVSGWVQLALGETDPKLRGEAIVGSVILLCFAAGALLGGGLHAPIAGLPSPSQSRVGGCRHAADPAGARAETQLSRYLQRFRKSSD